MSVDLKTLPNTAQRPLDPNVRQHQASDPNVSVWVNASAGTGKTKVLTDRVLRLLLPRADDGSASDPYKIVCLTFTKAAASEMKIRIMERLSQWASINDRALVEDLEKLSGHTPSTSAMQYARQLFARINAMPDGLNILTIHAFCQSVLARFPLESGVLPGFDLIEDSTLVSDYIRPAIMQTIAEGYKSTGSDLHKATLSMTAYLNQDQIFEVVQNVLSEIYAFESILKQHFNPQGLYASLCQTLHIPADKGAGQLAYDFLQTVDVKRLKTFANLLKTIGSKNDISLADRIHAYINAPDAKRIQTYFAIFLTTDYKVRASFGTKKIQAESPEDIDFMFEKAADVERFRETLNMAKCAESTRDLYVFMQEVTKIFQAMKHNAGVLDFNDLILRTEDLLRSQPSWVMYKMDRGIDHVLVDEAQDTNPEQWRIVEALVNEFYAGYGAKDMNRTLFVVGDEKQSIYGFQRASPEAFASMRDVFAQKMKEAKQNWRSVSLDISFRSVSSVLQAVDQVFAPDHMRHAISTIPIQHKAFRHKDGGLVHVHPLFENDDNDEQGDYWTPITEAVSTQTAEQKLCDYIAQTIRVWIDGGEILESKSRPIAPGDIMILLRKRGRMAGLLTQALHRMDIPVLGNDRLILKDHIIMQDIHALIQFCYNPRDNLSLVSFLKSPFINMSEDDLFSVCHPRDKDETVWAYLQTIKNKQRVTGYIASLIPLAKTMSPYEFAMHLLSSPCPADPISGERTIISRMGNDVVDTIEAYLDACLEFEKNKGRNCLKFVCDMQNSDSDIKRELPPSNMVRIMTVHGSKGLQAPIVFMPDTIRYAKNVNNNAADKHLWPFKTGAGLPYWTPRSSDEFSYYKELKSGVQNRDENEYKRLLYVAMTRAEDRLYILGAQGNKKADQDSWYYLVKNAMALDGDDNRDESQPIVLETPQLEKGEPDIANDVKIAPLNEPPQWIFKPVTQKLPRTMPAPIRIDDDPGVMRGTIIHKILEIVHVDMLEHDVQTIIHDIAHHYDAADSIDSIEKTISRIMRNDDMRWVFDQHAQSEIPITWQGKTYIIDRLLIQNDAARIVDFKTGDGTDLIEGYKRQLDIYRAALQPLYPDKSIECAILWIDREELQPI